MPIYIDGCASPNPGKAAGVAVLLDDEDTIIDQKTEVIAFGTNNQAEYLGLKKAVEMAAEHGLRKIEIFTDSELLYMQITGQYKIKDPKLQKLASDILDKIKTWKLEMDLKWVPREQNAIADALAKKTVFQREIKTESFGASPL